MAQQSSETFNCLRNFVKGYVNFFELYFTEYYKYLAGVASQYEEVERFIAGISGLVNIEGGEVACLNKSRAVIAAYIIAQIIHLSDAPHDRKLVKKLSLKIINAIEDPEIIERHLIEGAGQIFAHFEAQFMNISSDVSLESALKRVALDAVSRAISHLRENPDSNIDSVTLCKGLIKGKSRKCKEHGFWRDGHSIKFSDNVYSPDIFEKLGVKFDETYYAHKEMKHSLDAFGYRLSFEREPISCKHYTALPEAPPNEYEYLLSQKLLKELLANIRTCKDGTLELSNEELEEIRKEAAEHALSVLASIKKDQSKVDELLKEIIEQTNHGSEKVKPICTVGQPAKWFVGRTEELDQLDDMVNRHTLESLELHSLVTAISGLGGLGKSELARKYVHKHRGNRPDDDGRCKFFDAVWLNAEDDDTLASAFRDLAQRCCGLETKEPCGVDRDIGDIVNEVYGFLTHRNSTQDQLTLIIFDNVKAPSLGDFLPGGNHVSTKYRILITSRHIKWEICGNEATVLSLGSLQSKEAVELVKTQTQASDNILGELCKELRYFPLALNLAVAYILNNKETDSTLCAQDYLKKFLPKLKELGGSSESDEMSDERHYTRTTLAAFIMLVDRLENENFGASAIRILNIIGFTATCDIQIEMFCFLRGMDKEAVKEAVLLLVKYSLIQWEEPRDRGKKSVVCVQGFLQEMIRLRLVGNNDVEKALNETWLLMMSDFDQVIEVHFEAYFEQLNCLLLGDTDVDDQVLRLLEFIEEADQSGYYSSRVFRMKERYLRKLKGDAADLTIAPLMFAVARRLFFKFSRIGNLRGAILCEHYIKECLCIYEKFKPEEVPDLLLRKLRLYNGLWEVGKLEEHLGGTGKAEVESLVKQHVPAILDACDKQDDLVKDHNAYWVLGKAYMIVGEKEKAQKYLMDWLIAVEVAYKDKLRPYVDALLAYFRYNAEGELGVESKVFVLKKLKSIFGDSLGLQTYYAEEPYEFEPSCAIDGAVFSPPPPPAPPASNQVNVVVERSLLSRLLRLRFNINF